MLVEERKASVHIVQRKIKFIKKLVPVAEFFSEEGNIRTYLKGDLYGIYRLCTDHIAGDTVFYPACLKPEQGCIYPVGAAARPQVG